MDGPQLSLGESLFNTTVGNEPHDRLRQKSSWQSLFQLPAKEQLTRIYFEGSMPLYGISRFLDSAHVAYPTKSGILESGTVQRDSRRTALVPYSFLIVAIVTKAV